MAETENGKKGWANYYVDLLGCTNQTILVMTEFMEVNLRKNMGNGTIVLNHTDLVNNFYTNTSGRCPIQNLTYNYTLENYTDPIIFFQNDLADVAGNITNETVLVNSDISDDIL